jgi:integrase
LARYTAGDDRLLIITAAYTGMRWGELAGLQWIRTYLTSDQRIEIDPEFGALHEVRGRLTPGPPKTPASVRPIHLPLFLVELTTHHQRNPQARFVFTGADGGLRRRSNFRQRVWLPTLAGDDDLEWSPIQPGMHFHDLRHTHKTWLIEDGVPQVVHHQRLGHKLAGASGIYSHVTRPMIETTLVTLQQRWERYSTWAWANDPRQSEDVA